MNFAQIKRDARGWLSGRPRLLEAVFRATGKPYTEIVLFRSLIRPGDMVLDLGANIGQYTALFCRLVGPTGAVHAFEPIPPTFRMLEKHLARHAYKCHVFLNNFAAGDAEGSVTMFVADGRFTEASMVAHPLEGSRDPMQQYECRIVTVDDYLQRKNIQKVDFLKCDVEGAELLAMKGSKELFRSKTPPMLFLEAWSGWTKGFGYEPKDLFRFLEQEGGYAIYHLGRGTATRISVDEKLSPDNFPDFLNFLCIVPSVHGNHLRSLKDAGIVILEK